MTSPPASNHPRLGLEVLHSVEKIFGVELKVSLGWGAYYNAGEMGDMRPTWHDDASLAQSHRGEEGRRGCSGWAPKREVPFEYTLFDESGKAENFDIVPLSTHRQTYRQTDTLQPGSLIARVVAYGRL